MLSTGWETNGAIVWTVALYPTEGPQRRRLSHPLPALLAAAAAGLRAAAVSPLPHNWWRGWSLFLGRAAVAGADWAALAGCRRRQAGAAAPGGGVEDPGPSCPDLAGAALAWP